MKTQALFIKINISIFLLIIAGVFCSNPVKSQVNVNVNIGSQCLWGPVGYDYVEYYYLPEIDVFYYVPTGQYIYWRNNQQVFVTYLPASYQVNLYTTYKVIINEPKPYLKHNTYIVKYAKYKHGGPKQIAIRDSNDDKYYVVKGHPKHKGSTGNNKSSNTSNKKAVTNNKSHDNNNNNKTQNVSKSNKTNEQKSQPNRTQKSAPSHQDQQAKPAGKSPGSKGKGH